MSPLDGPSPNPNAVALHGRKHFWLFCILALGEFLIFDTQISRFQAWIFPRWSDQVQYLTEGYTSYETAQHESLAAGYWASVTKPSAQGVLDCPLVLTLFLLAGPSRSTALALNILFFIAAQFIFFTAILRQLRSPSLAWLGGSLFLVWCTVYSGLPGSGADFRLDFMTACALGVSLSVLFLSKVFYSRGWALLFGVSVGVTLLLRFLTGAYFVAIVAGLLAWLCFQREAKRRLINLALAIVVAAVLAGPFFWFNRSWIINYYWIGHFIGPESALRNPHMNLWNSGRFLVDRLYYEHLGSAFIIICFSIGFYAIVTRWLAASQRWDEKPEHQAREWLGVSIIFLLGPFLVLAVHSQKSAVVVSILVVPLMAIVLSAAALLSRRDESVDKCRSWPKLRWLQIVWVVLTVAFGGLNFYQRLSKPTYDANFARDARNVNTISDLIYQTSQGAHLESPTIGLDQLTEGLNGLALRVICYERHKRWVPFLATIPTGLFADKEELLMKRVTESDFLFIAIVDTPAPLFPSDAQLRDLRPKHLAWCRAHLKRVDQYELFGRVWELYVKPSLYPFATTPATKPTL